MSLKETLRTEMITALKAKNTDPTAEIRLATLRAVIGAISTAETSGKRVDFDNTQVENLLRKEAKTRRDSATTYASFNATDRAERETAEAVIIESFLPQELSEDEVAELVRGIIAEKGLEGPRALGAVMGSLKSRSDVNKGVASRIAKELLS